MTNSTIHSQAIKDPSHKTLGNDQRENPLK